MKNIRFKPSCIFFSALICDLVILPDIHISCLSQKDNLSTSCSLHIPICFIESLNLKFEIIRSLKSVLLAENKIITVPDVGCLYTEHTIDIWPMIELKD